MTPLQPLRILVVEDDPNVRETSSWMLEAEGFHVERATNAHEAWTVLQGGRAELVLSDVNMPEVSGVELAKRVADVYPQIPVILTSGDDLSAMLKRKNATCYLPKPFDRSSLIKAIYSAANESTSDA
jgi:CheY-like chemotaxis protein